MGDHPEGGPREPRRLTLRQWMQWEGRSLSDAADAFGSLMLSVRHIHRKRIVHADLKPDNLFCLAERSRVTAVRIGDFGLAAENQQNRTTSYGVLRSARSVCITGGTPGYVAPEVVSFSQVCPSEKVDIFACAVIFLELLLRPFRTQMERLTVIDKFRSPDTPCNVPDFIANRLPKCRALLKEMSEHDPARRLPTEEVYKRFEKEVRKELCRSSMNRCGSPSGKSSGDIEPAVQQSRVTANAKERPGAQGKQPRKGRKSGRGRGG